MGEREKLMGDWAICSRCGEEILPWMYSKEVGVCTSCYVIDCRGRFSDEEEEDDEENR
jgi:hypothetical protein